MSIEKLRQKLASLGVDIKNSSKAKILHIKNNTNDNIVRGENRKEERSETQSSKYPSYIASKNYDDYINFKTINTRSGLYKESGKALKLQKRYKIFCQKENSISNLKTHSSQKDRHTPLISVLSQLKEAEERSNKEKAKLQKVNSAYRLKANRLEMENKMLLRCKEDNMIDIKSLKKALLNKDNKIVFLKKRVEDLENKIAEYTNGGSEKITQLFYERDDLKNMLCATLKRLEAVDHIINETLIKPPSLVLDSTCDIDYFLKNNAPSNSASDYEEQVLMEDIYKSRKKTKSQNDFKKFDKTKYLVNKEEIKNSERDCIGKKIKDSDCLLEDIKYLSPTIKSIIK